MQDLNNLPETDEDFDEEKLRTESEDLLELRYLTKDNAIFRRTKGGFVELDYTDREKKVQHYDRVGVYRTFPVTEPDSYISIREADEKAREIGIVEKLSELDKEQADMLREQLRIRYYMPVIEKVLEVKEEYGYAYFQVKTNFGVCRFTTRMGGDAVIALSDCRYQITDLDGNRYEIPDLYRLSVNERKKLDLFI